MWVNTLSSVSRDGDSGALLSKTDLPSKQERYESPYDWPSTSGYFLLLSIFQVLEHLAVSKTFPFSISVLLALVLFFGKDGPGGTYCKLSGRLLVHPGRKWRVGGGGQEMEWELTLFSHTLALKSCTLGTTVKWSLTLHSLSTQEPSLTGTSWEELNLMLESKHSSA